MITEPEAGGAPGKRLFRNATTGKIAPVTARTSKKKNILRNEMGKTTLAEVLRVTQEDF